MKEQARTYYIRQCDGKQMTFKEAKDPKLAIIPGWEIFEFFTARGSVCAPTPHNLYECYEATTGLKVSYTLSQSRKAAITSTLTYFRVHNATPESLATAIDRADRILPKRIREEVTQ